MKLHNLSKESKMKVKYIIPALIILLTIISQNSFSQVSDPSGKSLPETFKKFNVPSLGENVLVFEPTMDMK